MSNSKAVASASVATFFLVKVSSQYDGYETENIHVILADNKKDASIIAIKSGSYNPVIDNGNGTFVDDSGGFIYVIRSVVALSQSDADVFIKHNI